MAINFLSLFGTNLKRSRPAPTPQGDGSSLDVPVPEITLAHTVKEKFEVDEEYHSRWFHFSSDNATLIASMTVSFTAGELKRVWHGRDYSLVVLRRINTKFTFRLFQSSASLRYFIVIDKTLSADNGDAQSFQCFIPLDAEKEGLWIAWFRNRNIPYSYLLPPNLYEISNEKVEKVEILNQTVFDSIIPNY